MSGISALGGTEIPTLIFWLTPTNFYNKRLFRRPNTIRGIDSELSLRIGGYGGSINSL